MWNVQWVVGFLVFLLPCAKYNLRAFMQPLHVYFGVMIFVFVIATSFAGMTEKLIFTGYTHLLELHHVAYIYILGGLLHYQCFDTCIGWATGRTSGL